MIGSSGAVYIQRLGFKASAQTRVIKPSCAASAFRHSPCVLKTRDFSPQSSPNCANLNTITYPVGIGRVFGTGILTPGGDESHRTKNEPTSSFANGCCRVSTPLLLSPLRGGAQP